MYKMNDIEELRGIGPQTGEKLRQAGISTTEDLLILSVEELESISEIISGLPKKRVGRYRTYAELMQVDGIDSKIAEYLFEIGITDLYIFGTLRPATVEQRLNDYLESQGLAGEWVTRDKIVDWQKRALSIYYAGTISGQITDTEERALSDVEVITEWEQTYTNADGRFWLPVIVHAGEKLVIRATDYETIERRVKPSPDRVISCHFSLPPAPTEPEVVDEAMGGEIHDVTIANRLVFNDITVSSLEPGTPLQFRGQTRDEGYRFQKLHRKRVGDEIIVDRVVLPAEALEEIPDRGTVFSWSENGLEKDDRSILEFRRDTLLKKFTDQGLDIHIGMTPGEQQ